MEMVDSELRSCVARWLGYLASDVLNDREAVAKVLGVDEIQLEGIALEIIEKGAGHADE